jgi:hypothetical protein
MGQAVVGVLAAGLAAYVFWQLVQAVLDPLHRARGLRGLGFRAVCVVSAALYGAPLLLARVPHDPAAGAGRAACRSRAGLAVPLDLFGERLAGAVSGGSFVRLRRCVGGGEPLVAAA